MTDTNPAQHGQDFRHPSGGATDRQNSDGWDAVIQSFDRQDVPLPSPWDELFGPLRDGIRGGRVMVIGQIGQSLDGRIATESGHSHYVNGPAGLEHLHRLRALVDAVVVGIGTALADDPLLTVRRVAGQNPARVVIDPSGRLPRSARLLGRDGARRVVITGETATADVAPDVELVRLPQPNGGIEPAVMLAALAGLGFRRILVEGGANTVSRFLAARCLDRLHVIVAPVIFGSGQAGVTLPPIARADQALRPSIHVHRLGEETLFDCDLSAQRLAAG